MSSTISTTTAVTGGAKVALVTGASSGFGAMTVRALADAGHIVYAGMRNIVERNEKAAADAGRDADRPLRYGVRLHTIARDTSAAAWAEAERLLVNSAENERLGRSWLMHGANVVYNVLSLLVLGLVFDRWASGALNAVVGVLIGEAMILTQPTSAEDTLRRYRSGEWDASSATPRPAWSPQVAVAPSHTGLRLSVSF